MPAALQDRIGNARLRGEGLDISASDGSRAGEGGPGHAVTAPLLERIGDRPAAIAHFRMAADKTPSLPERDYLIAQAARLRG